MKARILLGVGLALFFFAVLISTAPAHLVGRFLPTDQVYMSGFSGTLWEGRASSVAVKTEGGWLQLGQTDWSLSQLYLLLLSPTVQMESRWGQQRLASHVRVFPGGDVQLQDASASFSAGLIKRWLPVNLRGDINLLIKRMIIREGVPVQGEGRVVWQRAFWRGVRGSQPLGDYVLQFTVDAPMQGAAEVSTLSGPITIEGSLAVNGRKYDVDARLASQQGFDSELASALELMAAPVEGGFQLKFSSEF